MEDFMPSVFPDLMLVKTEDLDDEYMQSDEPKKRKSIQERLLECYVEDCTERLESGETVKESWLLEKIVKEDDLDTLIVNLYHGNEGYSLMLHDKAGREVETVPLPYEESEFLDYLDAQELPPVLIEVLESSMVDLFYDGCIIVELRDYRRSPQKIYFDSTFLLLRPTSQTIVRDVNSLMSDSSKWSQDDKLQLEAELVLAMKPRLCLDPSPEVVQSANRIQFNSKKLNNHGLKRVWKRTNQSQSHKTPRPNVGPSPPSFKLFDFISRHRDRKSAQSFHHKLNRTTQNADMWKQRSLLLTPPAKIDVNHYTKMHDQPKYQTDSTPEKIQEIVIEGEKTNNRSYYCRVTILRRPSTGEYIGELYLEEDRGVKEEGRKDGRACRFSLGNRIAAQRYLQQFQELYTEEGRKSVKISTFVANQQQQQQQQQRHQQTQQQSQQQTTLSSSTINLSQSVNAQLQVQHNSTPNAQQVVDSGSTPKTNNQTLQGNVFTQGNTYILTNAIGVSPHPVSVGSANMVAVSNAMSQSSTHNASALTTTFTLTASASPYYVPASGTSFIQTGGSKNQTLKMSAHKVRQTGDVGSQATNVQLTTAYIQPMVSGSSGTVTSQGLTAVPIAVPGTNVSIVPGNMSTQFITASGLRAGTQTIRPAGPTSITMLQNTQQQALQVGQQRVQAQFAVPSNLLPISQMTRNTAQQKGQQLQPGMASVMVGGKQVMVQGQTAMIQGQPTFIPSQTPIIPGQTAVLPSGQTAIIQGGQIFVQGQPGQASLVTGQHQGQTVMIQQGQAAAQAAVVQAQAQSQVQGAIVQGQTLSGQTVYIQGQPGGQASVVPGQTFMVQNQGQQSQLGQMSLITTTMQQTPTSQSLQIVQQVGQQQQQQQSIVAASSTSTSAASTALSALTSQVNLIPVQSAQQQQTYQPQVVQFSSQTPQSVKTSTRRRSSSGQTPGQIAKKKPSSLPK